MKNKLCGAFLLAVCLAVLHCVVGDYEVEVQLHEYNNPTSKHGMVYNGVLLCCDFNDELEVCEDGDRCDNYFVHCFRELGSDGPCISNEFNSSIFLNNDSIQFPSDESSLDVPMIGAWEGVQFYTAVMDDDAGTLQFIDNFTIDLNTSFLFPGAGFTARTVYNGVFGFGHLELSFQVSCAANFFGSDCATECIPLNNYTVCNDSGTLVCLPGFTGANCMINIDDCSNNSVCGPNGQCVDGIRTFTCQCSPGFTGANCTTNIDDCSSNNACGPNGQCVDGISTFNCQCSPGFTGEHCETEISECQGIFCSSNVDSRGNTNAIIGGVVGAVIGAIALVLILILILVILTKKKKSQLKKRALSGSHTTGSSNNVSIADNPIYGTSQDSSRPQVHEYSLVTMTATNTARPNGTSVDDFVREVKNPLYGTPGFDTGDPEDRVYAQARPV